MKKLLIAIISIFATQSLSAQVSHDSDLYKQLKARDSLLFDLGFNQCKISEFERFYK